MGLGGGFTTKLHDVFFFINIFFFYFFFLLLLLFFFFLGGGGGGVEHVLSTLYIFFVAVFLRYNQYWPVGFMVFLVLCPGTPGGSTGSSSGFKASQKT